MNRIPQPQRAFLAVTLLTVIAVTTVFMVYAAVLSTWTGNVVTVLGEGGSILYSLDHTTWQATLPDINTGTTWYAMLRITGAAAQSVTVYWYFLTGPSYTRGGSPDVTTNINLVAGTNWINATADGTGTGLNWGTLTTSAGTYKVEAEVNG